MKRSRLQSLYCKEAGSLFAAIVLTASAAVASEPERSDLILTSTNDPAGNAIVVFHLGAGATPELSYVATVPTGGKGGAGGNAGILGFDRDSGGAVANFGSNSVAVFGRDGDTVRVRHTVPLASGCLKPDSVALSHDHLFVVGANCAESHLWPSGALSGAPVHLTDPSAAQIAVGETWAAVTMTSGSVLRLPLRADGFLSGAAIPLVLPADANNTPLGEAFWGNVLGFTPAHSPDSFAIVNSKGTVFPVAGPTPPFPANAPCWVAKGGGNVWYTANSPGHAISIFFSDNAGGVFYKSIALRGAPTDITVSHEARRLAVIYAASDGAHVAVFSIDAYGGLTLMATSAPIGVASFSGVAISD